MAYILFFRQRQQLASFCNPKLLTLDDDEVPKIRSEPSMCVEPRGPPFCFESKTSSPNSCLPSHDFCRKSDMEERLKSTARHLGGVAGRTRSRSLLLAGFRTVWSKQDSSGAVYMSGSDGLQLLRFLDRHSTLLLPLSNAGFAITDSSRGMITLNVPLSISDCNAVSAIFDFIVITKLNAKSRFLLSKYGLDARIQNKF